jgi:hypothetical protein
MSKSRGSKSIILKRNKSVVAVEFIKPLRQVKPEKGGLTKSYLKPFVGNLQVSGTLVV